MARKPNAMRKIASATPKKKKSPIPSDVSTKYRVASRKPKRKSA